MSEPTCVHCKFFDPTVDDPRTERGLGHCSGFIPEAMNFTGWDDRTSEAKRAWYERMKAGNIKTIDT